MGEKDERIGLTGEPPPVPIFFSPTALESAQRRWETPC